MFKLFASPSALLLLACSEATATGNIAVIGGVNSIGDVDSIEIIAKANTEAVTEAVWEEQPKQTLTVPRSSVAAASLGGTLYAFGGLTNDGTAVEKCEELDTTKSDGWSACPDLLEPLIGHAAAAYDGKVYAIGGFRKGANVNVGKSLMLLDTKMDGVKKWVYAKRTMSQSRSWTAAVAVAGKLYVIGGVNGMGRAEVTSEVLDTTLLDQVQRDSVGAPVVGWHYLKNGNTKVNLKTPRFGHAAATYNGKIYVTGGVICADPRHRCGFPGQGNANTNEFVAGEKSLEILDTKISNANPRMSWTYGPQLETQRQLHASAFIGGMLVVMGGSTQESSWLTDTDASSDTNSVEMLDIANTDAVWVSGTPLTKKRQGFAAVAFTVTDADCELDPAVLGADDCTADCGTLTQAITTVATGSGTCDPATYACQPGDKECPLGPSVDPTAASVTAAAVALGTAGTKVAGFDVVAGSVTVVEGVGDDLIVRLTVEGDVGDFNEEAVKEALAQKLGVPTEWITEVIVVPGSIVITATVHNPDAGVADSPIDANSQVSDASHANLALVFVMVVMTSLQLVCY